MMSQTQKDKTAKRKDPLVRALSFWKLEGQTPRKAHFSRVLRFSPSEALMEP